MNRIVFKFPTVLLLQQKLYFSATLWSLLVFVQLYKWMFFSVTLYYNEKLFLVKYKVIFFMKIKYFQFCYVIRHTSSMRNCNKYNFHFSKVRASLSISRTWIQSHFLCTLRQLQKQIVLDYEIILENLSPAKKICKWYILSWHLINWEIQWNVVIAIAVIIMLKWVNIAPIV